MAYNRIQIDKKRLTAYENTDIYNYSIKMLFLEYLYFYLSQKEYKQIMELYMGSPDNVKKLGYRTLGNLIAKNIKFIDVTENEYLFLAKMKLDFDTSKLDNDIRAKLDKLYTMILKLFQV